MTTTHINRLRCSITNTPGTSGNIAIGPATSAARRTFTAAEDGKSFEPTFEDGLNWETRTGCVYTHSTATLTRGTLVDSSTGSAVALSSAATVSLGSTAKAMQELEPARGGGGKVELGKQSAIDINPNSGYVRVTSGDAVPRVLDLTHYQYGGTLRQTGNNGNIFELFLGDSGTPQVSLRGNSPGRGALFQARDADDVTGIFMSFVNASRPMITLEDNASSPDELAIDHPRGTGYLTFRTGGSERVRVTAAGMLTLGGVTSATPAIKNNSGVLQVRKADDSGYADLKAQTIYCNNGFDAGFNNIENVGVINQTNYHQMAEVTAPSAPSANKARIWVEDNGAGKSRLMVRFATGAAIQLAIEP